MNPTKLVIAIDFGGTIVRNEWPKIGKFRIGARKVLKWLKRRGHTLILNTCREKELLEDVHEFCWCHLISFHHYNKNCPKLISEYGGDCRKISADLYLDDRAFFPGWIVIPVVVLWLEWKKRIDEEAQDESSGQRATR